MWTQHVTPSCFLCTLETEFLQVHGLNKSNSHKSSLKIRKTYTRPLNYYVIAYNYIRMYENIYLLGNTDVQFELLTETKNLTLNSKDLSIIRVVLYKVSLCYCKYKHIWSKYCILAFAGNNNSQRKITR